MHLAAHGGKHAALRLVGGPLAKGSETTQDLVRRVAVQRADLPGAGPVFGRWGNAGEGCSRGRGGGCEGEGKGEGEEEGKVAEVERAHCDVWFGCYERLCGLPGCD